MKIPNSVKVGGHNIQVKEVPPVDIDNSGDYDRFFDVIRIRVALGITESTKAEVLIHEILECINYKNDLKLDHTVLTVISESMFQVMNDSNLDFSKG